MRWVPVDNSLYMAISYGTAALPPYSTFRLGAERLLRQRRLHELIEIAVEPVSC